LESRTQGGAVAAVVGMADQADMRQAKRGRGDGGSGAIAAAVVDHDNFIVGAELRECPLSFLQSGGDAHFFIVRRQDQRKGPLTGRNLALAAIHGTRPSSSSRCRDARFAQGPKGVKVCQRRSCTDYWTCP